MSKPAPIGRTAKSNACAAQTALPSSHRGPCRSAVCTLRPHDDRVHIDNYLGGFRWTA